MKTLSADWETWNYGLKLLVNINSHFTTFVIGPRNESSDFMDIDKSKVTRDGRRGQKCNISLIVQVVIVFREKNTKIYLLLDIVRVYQGHSSLGSS